MTIIVYNILGYENNDNDNNYENSYNNNNNSNNNNNDNSYNINKNNDDNKKCSDFPKNNRNVIYHNKYDRESFWQNDENSKTKIEKKMKEGKQIEADEFK